uniref:Uncharacterized protein n=1 Tax=Megaselia scalaris TaxID=36166 RepID=T1GJ14_MEGSC
MACPFLRRDESLSKQQSTDQVGSWQLEDELLDTADSDALSLTHLQMAIQLLTEPANEDLNLAVTSMVGKYSHRWPSIENLKIDLKTLKNKPDYDYLADIQATLL